MVQPVYDQIQRNMIELEKMLGLALVQVINHDTLDLRILTVNLVLLQDQMELVLSIYHN